MVRLITHNLLACHAKGCTSNNFPLQLKDVTVEMREADFNADFVKGFMPRIEWAALVNAAREVRNTTSTTRSNEYSPRTTARRHFFASGHA